MHYCLVICLVSSIDQIYHLAASRLGNKFDRLMTLGKSLGNNARLGDKFDRSMTLGKLLGNKLMHHCSILFLNQMIRLTVWRKRQFIRSSGKFCSFWNGNYRWLHDFESQETDWTNVLRNRLCAKLPTWDRCVKGEENTFTYQLVFCLLCKSL